MSNANKNAKAFREKFDKAGGDINSSITVKGNVNVHMDQIVLRSDAPNLHYWMMDAQNNERALIWHENSSSQLKFRVKSSNTIAALGEDGTFWAERFSTPNTQIGFHCVNEVAGTDGGLVRGKVEGGTWTNWRDRAAGVHVDAQNTQALAHTLIKATQWGRSHLFAMDVHYPEGGYIHVKMHFEGGQEQFNFTNSGNAYAIAGWHIGSDERFKENIVSVGRTKSASFLDKVSNLQVKQFNYRNDDKTVIGFIAQDVEKILPEAVSTLVDTTEENGEDRKFLNPMVIIAAQNQAIKELLARVEALESKHG
ncbi:MAG: tail fiber domain-containing protein [Fusobacteriaceae bacterium]